MPEQCSCGHAPDVHPMKMTSGSATIPPWSTRPCSSGGCACSEYAEDRAEVTDSERLIRIEDLLNQVLRKLSERQ